MKRLISVVMVAILSSCNSQEEDNNHQTGTVLLDLEDANLIRYLNDIGDGKPTLIMPLTGKNMKSVKVELIYYAYILLQWSVKKNWRY